MIGMQNISNYELALWNYAVEKLKNIPGLQLYCDTDPGKPRIGVVGLVYIHLSIVTIN
jgi:selenocysteine lyase/cysteine desulfurase